MRQLPKILPVLVLAACTMKPACAPHGAWLAPGSLRQIADPVASVASAPVILLGEHHDNAADHRWQLDTIQRIYAANPKLALGFEMFPRAAQPVLDAWVRGAMSEADFLARTDWKHVWGFDAAMYMPVFRFARDHAIPMLALNVSRHAVHLVATAGWAALPVTQREGVSTPAAPSAAYRANLQDAMSGHGGPAMTPERLDHFIDAQLFWDRAMAEAIAAARAHDPQRSVVALMGAGHLQQMEGVPHQLQALGVTGTVVLLPDEDVCQPFPAGYANAIYVE